MLAAIDAAREYVLLEMYLVESSRIASRFVEALRAARARGVRACVMFDCIRLPALQPRRPPAPHRGRRRAALLQSAAPAQGPRQPAARSPQAAAGRRQHGVRRRRGPHRRVHFRGGERTVARADGRDQRSGGRRLAARLRAHLAPQRSPARPARAARVRARSPRRPRTAVPERGAAALGARERRPAPHRCRGAACVDHERLLRALAALSQGAAPRGAPRRGRAAAAARATHRSSLGAPGGAALLRQDAAQRRADLRVPAAHAARQDDPVR